MGEKQMRKKSHISLAGYLVQELSLEELEKHKKAFYLGSILPDLTPKMITSPHEFHTSFDSLRDNIRILVADAEDGECRERVLWRRIGVVMHYLADYFTFPHNETYQGSLKDHCLYERDMKHTLREYVRTQEAERIFEAQQIWADKITTMSELFAHIEKTHDEYLKKEHTVADDCRWILEMCSQVLLAIVRIMCRQGVPAMQLAYQGA